MSQYLDQLNPVQREAAVNYQGPSIIVAGAGSGKTRVLTYRIAHMLEEGVPAYNILALTFTNKAAREMKERIETVVSPARARSLWMGTFHSVFARILRSEAEKLGYPSSFTIYDSADSRNVVKMILKEMNLSDETYKPNQIASRISLAKNNLVTAAAYESNTVLMAEDREQRRPQFVEVYKKYVQKCRENGAMDFDDLLLNMNILFRDHPDALAKYQYQFRYVMVDEYQDTNMAQYLIIKKIVEQHHNVCVVGDDAQSIYSFRGAKIENILRFQKDYPEAKIFKLEQNYRSTQTIVNAANSIIEKNQKQIRKKSFSSNDEGEKIRVFKAYTDQEEALIVVNDIFALTRGRQIPYNNIAILYRTNAQSRVLEEGLRSRNIPYKIFGGQSFYQRKEIKDVLAYIRLVVNHKDDEAFRRIINYPTRGIGDVTVGKIAATAERHGISMWQVISTLTPEQMELKGAAAKKLADFKEMIAELSAAVYTTPAYEMGLKVATRSGIIGSFRMQQTPEAISVLENIEELLNSIASYTEMELKESPDGIPPTIDAWLQNVSLLTDMDNEKEEDRNRVTLMTIHSAKGLEFDYVYIVGLEETLFPSQMCTESQESLEEERRLFYVALTRAKTEAMLSFAQTRFRWGSVTSNRPSRFIKEIDSDYLNPQYDEDPFDNFMSSAGEDSGWNGGARRPYQRPESSSQGGDAARRKVNYPGRAGAPERKPVPPRTIEIPRAGTEGMKSMGKRLVSEASDEPKATAPSTSSLAVGSRVEHEKFGQGTVSALEETANGAKATVDFDAAGSKTLLLKYAKLRVL
ncbi:UvrD-helicase domain-containing protein [Alistipes sp. OttesenSCG-928-L06]|nr:UvrD-helicase domain-containing protein [Alistipes sp. OttesenSCG-928-L06]